MPATTREALGASTLVRKWYLDVNTGTVDTPIWTGVFGIMEFKAPKEPTLQDDSDFYSGWKSQNVTALAWSIELKVARKVDATTSTIYDPGQEKLRAISDEIGPGNRVQVRWYEMTDDGPRVEAYSGYAAVTWTPDGGPMDANETVTVTLSGQGERTAITHPDTAAVPTVTDLDPYTDTTAGGALVTISGSGFTGTVTDGVLFGVETADYVVISDNQIVAVAPAQAAGTVDVTVENATGVSTVVEEFIYTTP